MFASRHPVRYIFAEYLAHEEASNTKHDLPLASIAVHIDVDMAYGDAQERR
jgi:hypothetical protein